MKVYVDADERYPDYEITENGSRWNEIELPDDFVARFRAATEEYNVVQREMNQRWRARPK